AGFSIFYMGINIGAFFAPLACGYLGENIDWHYGFGLAGVGMVLGLIQYVLGDKHLGMAGKHPIRATTPEARAKEVRSLRIGLGSAVGALVLIALLGITGLVEITAEGISNAFGFVMLIVVLAFFGWLYFGGDWTVREKRQLYVIGVLFLGAVVFFSAFEQAGSTMNLFASDRTDRQASWLVNLFGLDSGEFPASWLQSLNPLYIISLAPVFAWMWIRLGPKDPSSPAKFAGGLFLVGLGFVILMIGSIISETGVKVSPMWLVVAYLCHTLGELSLSPVGLSAMTKLAPARVASLMMGVWFTAAAVGNYMSGFLARFYESMALPTLFGSVAAFAIVAALILAVFVKPIKRMLSRPA
ncbi:MAG TPA: peptide MFS transporter, partial [Rhodothermales bacterium]